MLHAVILAGGKGERFWPQSRRDRPKQLLPLLSERTLLSDTLDRLVGLVEQPRMTVVTAASLVEPVRATLADAPQVGVYGEPVARNTAAACVYGAVRAHRLDPDAVCIVLPSDHLVRPLRVFHDDLRRAVRRAEAGDLVTFGIPPARPETGYGYIEAGAAFEDDAAAFHVAAFHEKPDAVRAAEYVARGTMWWNSGMFVWRADVLLAAVAASLPELAACATRLAADWQGEDGGAAATTFYETAPSISIDYGVLERARNIATVRAAFEWDDVGEWGALPRLRERDAAGNVTRGDVIALDVRDSVLLSDDGLLAVLGVQDVAVVRTRDVTLIAPLERAQEVRALLAEVRARGWTRYE